MTKPANDSHRPVNLRAPDMSRFPALRRLSWRGRRRRIPFVAQLEMADCGAACLTMLLRYHGRQTRLEEVRTGLGSGRDGVNALGILETGRHYGLRGRALKLDVQDLRYLTPGAILYWGFDHFVVFERVVRGGIVVVDPGWGRRRIPTDQVRRAFTGLALVLEPSDDFRPSAGEGSRLWAYLRKLLGQRRLLSQVLVTSLLLRLLALALPLLTALIVDRVVPRNDSHLLLVAGLGLGAVIVFQMLSSLIRAHLLLQLRTNLDTRLTIGFLDHLANLPYSFFQRRSAGDLMMRVASNTTIREMLTSNTLSSLLDGVLVLIYLGLICWLHLGLGLLTLGLAVLQVVVYLLSRRPVADLMSEGLEAQARAQSYLAQMLSGIETLKVAGAEHHAVQHWSDLFVDELNVSLKRGRLQAMLDAALSVLGSGSPLLILSVGAMEVMTGQLTLGGMLALNALAVGMLTPLGSLVSSALQLQQIGSYIDRIDDVLTLAPEQDREQATPVGQLGGHVHMRNVSFRYGPQSPLALDDISLEIDPGRCVALVGRSGSGKSTLASVLLGLHSPTEGAVYYDDRRLDELVLSDVRRKLGIVPQHPFIFGRSIRENIALADPSIGLDRVVAAAKLAALHEEISAMPMGYDTVLADGGASLSGGQRQRIALARALVHEPAILLLDEATSAVDNATERRIMDNLAQLPCARIIIAHRLSTITFADEIVVMDAGRIAERGAHAELMEQRGIYHELVTATDADASADHSGVA